MNARHVSRCLVVGMLSIAVLAARLHEVRGDDKPAAEKPLDKAALEKDFQETMSGATLIGTFTVRGQTDKKLNEEKYTIESVKKVGEDKWLFKSRIQYGTHDLTVPLTLDVKWAGDTPVITLTDMPVPGFGTFTCRVLVFRKEYAGTWDGGDHGGHLFGRIVPKGETAEAKPGDGKKSDEKAGGAAK
ncbi:MAG TPA: hypothetical protein VHD36_20655 [Pirellulales bacterium]|nr:hypothetical protein [Pirellulales bacterium]